jgi:hypothetical protein
VIRNSIFLSPFSLPLIMATLAWALIPALSAEEEKVLHRFRVIPLGDQPPFRQELREGVRYEVDPPEGSVPPSMLEVITGGESGVESDGKLLPFRLRLGSPSPVRTIRVAGTPGVGLEIQGGEEWAKVPLSRGGRTLAVAWRDAKDDWRRPRFMALEDGPAAVPPGTVRLVNASGMPIAIRWGEVKLAIRPGKVLSQPFPDGAQRVVMMVLYPAPDGGFRQIFSNIVDRDASKIHQFFIYQTDGAEARAPVRVVPLVEDRSAPEPAVDSKR